MPHLSERWSLFYRVRVISFLTKTGNNKSQSAGMKERHMVALGWGKMPLGFGVGGTRFRHALDIGGENGIQLTLS
jgi:hypothetical protein